VPVIESRGRRVKYFDRLSHKYLDKKSDGIIVFGIINRRTGAVCFGIALMQIIDTRKGWAYRARVASVPLLLRRIDLREPHVHSLFIHQRAILSRESAASLKNMKRTVNTSSDGHTKL
jgi:hypothetical protein